MAQARPTRLALRANTQAELVSARRIISCPDAEACECSPNTEGNCITEASTGEGEISTSSTFETSIAMVELVFN